MPYFANILLVQKNYFYVHQLIKKVNNMKMFELHFYMCVYFYLLFASLLHFWRAKQNSENILHLLKLPLRKNWEFLSSKTIWKSRKENKLGSIPCFSFLFEIFKCLSFSRFSIRSFSSLLVMNMIAMTLSNIYTFMTLNSLSRPDYIPVLDRSIWPPVRQRQSTTQTHASLSIVQGCSWTVAD